MGGVLKPRVFCESTTSEVRVWPGRVVQKWTSRIWLVYCPCTPERYLAAVPSWGDALEIAMLHNLTTTKHEKEIGR